MTEHPLIYIFSLQDNLSDKLRPIMELTERVSEVFTELESRTSAISTAFNQTGGAVNTLQEEMGLLKEEKEMIPAENIELLNAYNQEVRELNKQVGQLTSISGKSFIETAIAINTLCESAINLKSQEEWIPANCIESIQKCSEAVEDLLQKASGFESISNTRIEKTAVSVITLQDSIIALNGQGEWIAAEKTQVFVECRQQIEEVTKEVKNLNTTVENNPVEKLAATITDTLPGLSKFIDLSSLAGSAISGINNIISKGETAWASYKDTLSQFGTSMRRNIGATDEEVNSLLSWVDAQQKLGVIGKQVQMAGIEEISTHITRHQSIQELLPTLNNAIAQQHGVNASQEQATEIASAFGAVLNGQTDVLSQYGYQFTEAQNRILMYGDETERVSALMEIVGSAVNGVNEALGQTPEGEWQQYEEKMNSVYTTIGKLKEQFTQTLFPIFKTVGDILEEVVGKIDDKMDSISIVLGTIATGISEVFQFLSPILTGVVDTLGFFFEELANGNPFVIGITAAIGAMAVMTALQTIKTAALNVVQGICNTLFFTSPLGWIAAAIGAVVAAVVVCWNKFEGFRKVIMGVWEVIKELGKSLVEAIIGPLKQITKGLGSIFGAIGSALKGNFSDAWTQAKEGVSDVTKGIISGSPIGLTTNFIRNTDFTGAYDKGAQKAADSGADLQDPNNGIEISEDNLNVSINPRITTNGLTTSKIVPAILPAAPITSPTVELPDKSMLPDIKPTAEYKEIAARLTPQKVDLAPAKTATESKNILQAQKETNNTITNGGESKANEAREFIVNDAGQLYQPEEKENILQSILENVQKLVDMFKEAGNIKNIFNTSFLKLNDISVQINTEHSNNESGESNNSLKNAYSNIVTADSSLTTITRSTSDIVANTDTLISLFASYVSESRGNSSTPTGESPVNIPEFTQPEQLFSITDIILNMKNSFMQQIESAKNSLTEVYEAFISFTQNDPGSKISNGIQDLIDKLTGDISEKLHPETLIEKIKETFDKINIFMDTDLSKAGTNIVTSFVDKLEDLFNEITGSEFITNLTQGFEKIKDKILNNIPDDLSLDSITEGIREAFEKLNNLMNVDLSTVGTEIANSFMNKIESIFNDLLNSDPAVDLSTLIETIREKTTGSIPDQQDFETIFQEIKNGLNQINPLTDIDLTAIGTEIGDTFVSQIEDIFTSITESDLATTIRSKIESIKNNISSVIPENLKLNTIFDGVKDFADKVNSFLNFDIDLSGIESQLTTSFNNLKEKLNQLTQGDWLTMLENGLTEIKELVIESVPEEMKSNPLFKEIKETVTEILSATHLAQPVKTAYEIIEKSLEISDIPETVTDPSSLPAEAMGTEAAPEIIEKKKSKRGGLLKRALTQAGVMAIAGIAGGITNAGAAADKIDTITAGGDGLPGTVTAEDELGLANASSSAEGGANPALTSITENERLSNAEVLLPETGFALLPLPTPAEEGLSSMPSFIMTDSRLLTSESLSAPALTGVDISPEGEPEGIGETGNMFDHLFDSVRQMAAITAIPLVMTTLSPDNNLQSTAMFDENINNSSLIFDQSEEANEKEGRSISIDQVCEQIVIHVENTDREGTEHIKEEIYRVLREIVES